MNTGNLNNYKKSETRVKLVKRRENEEKQEMQATAENVIFTINRIPIERVLTFCQT